VANKGIERNDETIEIMMLQGPPIDKVCALALVLNHQYGIDLKDPEALRRVTLRFQHAHPALVGKIVEVDVTNRYHDEHGHYKAPSATQMEARRFDLLEQPGVEFVCADLAGNNQTGFLKKLPFPFAWLIREQYELPHTVANDVSHRTGVIMRMLPICADYFLMASHQANLERLHEKWQSFRQEFFFLRELIERYYPDLRSLDLLKHPLTIVGQAFHRYARGEDVEAIRKFLDVWLSQFEEARRNDPKSKKPEELIEMLGDRLSTWKIGTTDVLFVDGSVHPGVPRALFKNERPAAIVSRDDDGCVAIQFSMKRRFTDDAVRYLYEDLDHREPGLWYLHPRPNGILSNILNGTPAVRKSPSMRTTEEIEDALRDHLAGHVVEVKRSNHHKGRGANRGSRGQRHPERNR
jgi:hypothetical protein